MSEGRGWAEARLGQSQHGPGLGPAAVGSDPSTDVAAAPGLAGRGHSSPATAAPWVQAGAWSRPGLCWLQSPQHCGSTGRVGNVERGMWGKESPCRGWGVIGNMARAGGSTRRRSACMDKGTNPLSHGYSQERTEARAVQDWTVRGCSPSCWGKDGAVVYNRELELLQSFAVCFFPCLAF